MGKRRKKVSTDLALASAYLPRDPSLLADIRQLIESARQQTAHAVNSALVGMYWHIGARIRKDVLKQQRAEYGKEIVATLSKELTAEYGRGFGQRSLFRMVQFSESFPEEPIVSALSTQLGWSHFVELISLEDRLKREFNIERQSLRRSSNDGNLPISCN